MDIIHQAMKKKQHVSKRKELNDQTLQDFEEQSKGKKIALFGVSACADYFFEHYKNVRVDCVVDNDTYKQGLRVGDFCFEAEQGQMEILPPDSLKRYSVDNLVVLITSTNYYEPIILQLEQLGITRYFVFIVMEAKRRIMQQEEPEEIDEAQLYRNHVENCCHESINNLKIVFSSFGTYSDHGKYIAEALLRVRQDLDIVYLLRDLHVEVPAGVRKVFSGNWKRCIYELETAKIWIYNTPIPSYMIKRPEQIYIQTKHWASVTLKKFYLDSPTTQDNPKNVDNWRYNSKIMDYMITGSDFDTESCRRGFGFEGEVCQAGSARSDALFRQEELRKKIYEYYQIDLKMHLLLYAPTYRFNRPNGEYAYVSREIDLDYKMVKIALEKRFGGEWSIMLRLHPSVAKEGEKIEKPPFVIDASFYEDGEELVSACEIMVSDYSSIMFEPAFVEKPVFLFATDREAYIGKDYDLLLDYDMLPFPKADSNEKLEQCIMEFDEKNYKNDVRTFLEKYGVHEDGHASERAAEFISSLIPG